ncbi:uncharacterized protein LOC110431140 [Sorghum bicolor]|uniref:uncharacterized protein LOC110431140 n=1 Tax=Sorghum bicolor TaxID=4558 RepID=UPI000B425576|nr:uncharacterized protein LOC110431140 [Sorghum bicolor]|eukprot:XP_021305524.1 uncharacterized protein LOC110431140 [Sorghum bicolor]
MARGGIGEIASEQGYRSRWVEAAVLPAPVLLHCTCSSEQHLHLDTSVPFTSKDAEHQPSASAPRAPLSASAPCGLAPTQVSQSTFSAACFDFITLCKIVSLFSVLWLGLAREFSASICLLAASQEQEQKSVSWILVSAIIESSNYDTITVDELFSKLKSTEIDYQTQDKFKNPSAPTMALVSGNSSSSSANPSQMSFALSSFVSASKEQLETLGDDELALIISRFSRFHNNRLNRRRGGDQKVGCYNCGDLDHFVAHCPKKNKHSSDKYDSGKRKDKHDYTSKKYKSKKGFDKEALKKMYRKKAKAQERAFLASLSDLDNDSGDDRSSSPSSDDESERKMEEKLTGLCFVADSTHGGFCTMAIDEEVKASKDEVSFDDDTSEIGGLENTWLVDSSCSRHMTGSSKWFSNLNPVQCKEYITFGDNSKGKVLSHGTIRVNENFVLKDVALVSNLHFNLLLVSQLLQDGFEVRFKTGLSRVLDSQGNLVCQIVPFGRVFRADFSHAFGSSRCLVAGSSSDLWKWHRRLGHLSFDLLARLSSLDIIRGLPKLKFEKDLVCHPCRHGKMVAASHPPVTQVMTKGPGELLHMDIVGLAWVRSEGGKWYVLVIVDDFSRYSWVFFMQGKDEAFSHVRDLILRLQTELPKNAMRAIRSDNGTEFKNTQFDTFCVSLGLEHQFSSPYVPQQNCVVERKNRTLVEMARTMLDEHRTPRRYWLRRSTPPVMSPIAFFFEPS